MKMKRVIPVVAAMGVIGGIAAAGTAMGWKKRKNGHMAKKRPGAQSAVVPERS